MKNISYAKIDSKTEKVCVPVGAKTEKVCALNSIKNEKVGKRNYLKKDNFLLLLSLCFLLFLMSGCVNNTEESIESNASFGSTENGNSVESTEENSSLGLVEIESSLESAEDSSFMSGIESVDASDENSSFEEPSFVIPVEEEVVGHYVDMTGMTFLWFWHKEEVVKWIEGTSDRKTENEEFEIVSLYEYDIAEKARQFILENGIFNFLINGKIQPIVPEEYYYSIQVLCSKDGLKISYNVKLEQSEISHQAAGSQTEITLTYTGIYGEENHGVNSGYTANGGYFDVEIYDADNKENVKTKALFEIGERLQDTNLSFNFGKWTVRLFGEKDECFPLWFVQNMGLSSFLSEEDFSEGSENVQADYCGNGFDERFGFAYLNFKTAKDFKVWLCGEFKGEVCKDEKGVDVYLDSYLEYARKLINERGVYIPVSENEPKEYTGGIWVKCDRFKKVRVGFSEYFNFEKSFLLTVDYSQIDDSENISENIVDFLEKENTKYGDTLYSFDPETRFYRAVKGEASEKINAVFCMDGVESRSRQTEYFVYDGRVYILKYSSSRYYTETQQFDFVFGDLK